MSEPKNKTSRLGRSSRRCYVGGCSNTSHDGFSLFTMPTDRATVRGWIHFIRNTRSDFNPKNYTKVCVCSGHFKLNQFDFSTVMRYRNSGRSFPPIPLEGEFPCIKIAVNPFNSIPVKDDQHDDEDQSDTMPLQSRGETEARPKKAFKSDEKKTKESEDKLIKWQLLPSKYGCKLCEVLCKELTDLKEHIVQIHSNQEVSRPKKKKNNGNEDTRHVGILEEGLISDFEVSELSIAMRLCPICDQYVKEARITSHLDMHQLKNAICEVCGLACTNTLLLSRHKARCKSANKWHKCEYCEKEYSSLGSLRGHHYRSHKNKPKVIMQCERCEKDFTSVKYYRKHLTVHMTVKPYECPDCGKGFTQRSNMTNHRRVHTGDKPYKCDMCTEMFAHNVSLKTHKKKKHNVDMWKDG